MAELEHLRIERAWVRAETRARLFGGDADAVRVGRFTLRARRGAGAMGTVWAAHDPTLDRLVALKVLHVDAREGDGDAPALREARAVARLAHPHVIPVFEVGRDGDALFVVSELVDGVHLRAWCDAPRSLDTKLEVLGRIGEALATAHSLGIVHHDVKPENVLVDAAGRPRLGDFGLASIGARVGSDVRLPGTPRYAAPEKLLGAHADAATDQFAFALMALEVLLGHPVFEATSPEELLASVRRGPTFEAPRALSGITRVLARSLSESPADRYSSMFELLVALRAARSAHSTRPTAWRLVAGGATLAVASVGLALFAVEHGGREAATSNPPDADAITSSGPTASAAVTEEVAITREVLVLTKAGRWDECAALLSKRANTKDLLVLWIGCAEVASDSNELGRACAAWRAQPAVTAGAATPDVCSDVIMDARAAYLRGDYAACAERILAAPPTNQGTVQLTRCSSRLGGTKYQKRVCEYQTSMEPPDKRVSCSEILDLR